MSQEIKQKCAIYTSTTSTVVESTDSGVSLEKRKKEASEPIYLSRF